MVIFTVHRCLCYTQWALYLNFQHFLYSDWWYHKKHWHVFFCVFGPTSELTTWQFCSSTLTNNKGRSLPHIYIYLATVLSRLLLFMLPWAKAVSYQLLFSKPSARSPTGHGLTFLVTFVNVPTLRHLYTRFWFINIVEIKHGYMCMNNLQFPSQCSNLL